MNENVKIYVRNTLYCIAGIAIIVCVFMLGRCSVKTEPVETKTDTVTVVKWDTVKIEKEKIKYKEVKTTDTLYVHDTVLVKESKLYQDSISKIWISGYQPEIDSIEYTIPYKEVKITETIYKQKKMGLNVSVCIYTGYGLGINNNQVIATPEVGVGVALGYGWIIK